MTSTELKAAFNAVIAKAHAAGHDVSKMEVCREYFTNPAFKADLQQTVWETNRTRAL
jgi:hypothetical protein